MVEGEGEGKMFDIVLDSENNMGVATAQKNTGYCSFVARLAIETVTHISKFHE